MRLEVTCLLCLTPRAEDAVDKVVNNCAELKSRRLKLCDTLTTGLVGLEGS